MSRFARRIMRTATLVPSTVATTGLFFVMNRSALAASNKKVLAHYFPPFPISLDNNVPTNDYYKRNYLDANGESGTHAASGGFIRNRPQGRAPLTGDFRLLDARADVVQAYDGGLDGFFVDILGSSGNNWTIITKVVEAGAIEHPGGEFMVIPMIDGTGSMAEAGDVNVAADRLAYFAFINLNMPGSGNWSKSGTSALRPTAYFLPDGRYVVASFKAEGQAAAWWNSVFVSLKTRYDLDVAFIAVFNNFNMASSYGGYDWQYTTGSWGFGADPNLALVASNQATASRGRGELYCGPISGQNVRTNSRNTYDPVADESVGFGSLREHWLKAIRENWEWTQLVTWNDYSEGGEFAVSATHGYCNLDISNYYLHRLKTGSYPAIVRDAVYIAHRNQFWNSTITGPQTKFFEQWNRGANISPKNNSVEILTFLTAAASVTVYIGGNTHTYTAPQGMNIQHYPLAYGQVRATATRVGQTIAAVTSPVNVMQYPAKDDMQYYKFSSIRGTSGQFDPQVQAGP